MNSDQPVNEDNATVYASSPYKVGNYQWQVRVITLNKSILQELCPNGNHAPFALTYYWRVLGENVWNDQKTWPSYDFNDGTHSGCPQQLDYIFQQEKPNLSHFFPWLKGGHVRSSKGKQLILL